MSNHYTSPYVSIIPGEGTMYREATTYNNNHNPHNSLSNDNTNLIIGAPIPKRKRNNKRHTAKSRKRK